MSENYPSLKESSGVAPFYFPYALNELYLNLCRKEDDKSVKSIYKKFCNAIANVNDNESLSQPNKKEQLTLLYKLIPQTRDITYGKGERLITYVLICAWYKYFPVSACFALKLLVVSNDNEDELFSPFGSWCDIKYFCGFVNDVEFIDDKAKTILIDTAIGLLNHQINKDRISWNKAMANYLEEKANNRSTFMLRPNGRDILTFACKWCPRENSKFGWLYDKIVIQWTKMFSPHLNIDDDKCFSLCKRNFRKMISALNKELNTVQIEQCNNNWKDINPETVSVSTLLKQRKAFNKEHTQDRIECKNNFDEYYQEISSFGSYDHSLNRSLVPLSNIVGYALSYIKNETKNENQRNWINHIWTKNLHSVKNNSLDNSIPIIDISWDLNTNSRNSAIALGVAVAVKSNIHRIVLFENIPYWLSISPNEDFISIIEKIYDVTKHATSSNIDAAFSLMIEGFDSTVTFNNISAKDDVIFFVFNGGKDINTILKNRFHSSTFIYWNIQRTGYFKYKDTHALSGNFYLCGDSITTLNNIEKYYLQRFKVGSLSDFIINILNAPRYKVMESLLIDIM